MDSITDERLQKEFDRTEEALQSVTIILSKEDQHYQDAEKFLDTATRYYEDAKFFRDKNDKGSAFGALNYAFGWIDAGKVAGFFKEKSEK